MGKRLRRRNDVTLQNNDPSPMNNVNVDQERLRVAESKNRPGYSVPIWVESGLGFMLNVC